MRETTAAQRGTLAQNFNIHHKLFVEDPDGALVDMAAMGSVDWLLGAEWGVDIDQPMVAGTFRVRRESTLGSVAPLVVGSPFNRNGLGNYAPRLTEGRLLGLLTAVVPVGVAPVYPTDYQEMFYGKIDRIQAAGAGELTLQCRDVLSRFSDAWIENPTVYSTPAGQPSETVIQAIIDQWMPNPPTIYVPVSPGWIVRQYEQQPMTVLAAIMAITQQSGSDFRYRWNNELAGVSKFRFTFYNSHLAKTVPDATFGPTEYLDVHELDTSDVDIRNAARGYYYDSAGALQSVAREDAASIALYGRRFIQFAEGPESNLNTASEMNALLGIALSDLAFPPAVQEIETLFFWPTQLGDLYRFLPNGIHYDEAQDWYVTGWRHQLLPNGSGRTVIKTRGTIAGAFGRWLRQAATPPTEDQLTIGPSLVVTAVWGLTEYQVIWGGIGVVTLSTDGGVTWGPPPPSPITVPRGIPGQPFLEYTFSAVRNGQEITNTISIPPLGVDAVTPDLSVVPGAMTATTVAWQPVASNPFTSVTPSLTLTYVNCTGNKPAGAIVSGTVVIFNRPAFASTPAFARFRATVAGGGFEEITIPIPNQDKLSFGPSLTVTPTVTADNYSIAWSTDAVTVVTLKIDNGTTAAPPASPIVVARNDIGGAAKLYNFYGVADGKTTSVKVTVLPKDAGTPPVVPPSLDAFYVFSVVVGTDTINLRWTVSNAPAGHTFDLYWEDSADIGGGPGSIVGVATPYDFTAVPIVVKGTGGALPTIITFELRMLSSLGVVLATKTTSRSVYAIP